MVKKILIILGLALVISLAINTQNKEEPIATPTPEILGDEFPIIQESFYLIGEFDDSFEELNKHYEVQSITLSKALSLPSPSVLIINFEDANLETERLYYDLVDAKHAVLFTGLQLDPEDIVPLFGEKTIPVVPIEGTLPTFFQAYGAMFSTTANKEIPIFFGTNLTDTYDIKGLAKTIAYLEEQLEK